MIYFTQDSYSLNIKIGFVESSDEKAAHKRRRQLQTGNSAELVVLATMPGGKQDESNLHARFAKYRVGGEWFKPAPELMAEVLRAARESLLGRDVRRADWFRAPEDAVRLKVYVAGKMDRRLGKGSCWRESMLDGADLSVAGLGETDRLPVIGGALGGHDYLGPYYFDEFGGHSTWPDGTHGTDGRHGDARDKVRSLCLDAIRRCDILFAWIETEDCHGTVAEIGYATAAGKKVAVACHNEADLKRMWFPAGMGDWRSDAFTSPGDAFHHAVGQIYGRLADAQPPQDECEWYDD